MAGLPPDNPPRYNHEDERRSRHVEAPEGLVLQASDVAVYVSVIVQLFLTSTRLKRPDTIVLFVSVSTVKYSTSLPPRIKGCEG